jgi:hypothetical protein
MKIERKKPYAEYTGVKYKTVDASLVSVGLLLAGNATNHVLILGNMCHRDLMDEILQELSTAHSVKQLIKK